jgi:hypothetical protein
MLIERGTDLLISYASILLFLLLTVHLQSPFDKKLNASAESENTIR